MLKRLIVCLIAATLAATSIAVAQNVGRRMTAYSPYNPAWTPASAASLIGFIDFENNAKITVDGSNNITTIVDTTNGASFTQATTANKPLLTTGHNSRQVARFTAASSQRLIYTTNAFYPLTGAFEWWVTGYQNVADGSASTSTFFTVGSSSAGQFYGNIRAQSSSLSSARCQAGNGAATTSNIINNSFYVFDGRFSMRCVSTGTTLISTAWGGAAGGQGATPSNVTVGSISNVRAVLGANGAGTGNFLDGDISSIAVFSAPLTGNDSIQMGYWSQVRL